MKMDTISRQNIHKKIANLNNSVNQLNLTDTYGTPHSTKAEYIFF